MSLGHVGLPVANPVAGPACIIISMQAMHANDSDDDDGGGDGDDGVCMDHHAMHARHAMHGHHVMHARHAMPYVLLPPTVGVK